MSKRTYEEYIKNGCHPVGYNEPCQSYYFGQVSVDWLLDQIDQLKQQLAEKDKEFEELNKTLEMCKHIERYDIGEMFLENAKLIIEKRQFAIQELEKVKVELKDKIKIMNNEEHCYPQKFVKWIDVCDQLNQQINDLRGDENGKF